MEQYFAGQPARLPRGRDAGRRQDDVRAVGRRRAARPPAGRPDHDRGADRAPQAPVGRGRRPGRHPDRPDVLRGQGQDLAGLRRHRGDLRRCRGEPAGDADPHRAVQDPGDPRRGPPRRRRAVVGRGRARGLRAGRPPAGADRHAVPLRRQPDPVRHLRARRRRHPALGRPTTPTATPTRWPTTSSARCCSWPTPARCSGAPAPATRSPPGSGSR